MSVLDERPLGVCALVPRPLLMHTNNDRLIAEACQYVAMHACAMLSFVYVYVTILRSRHAMRLIPAGRAFNPIFFLHCLLPALDHDAVSLYANLQCNAGQNILASATSSIPVIPWPCLHATNPFLDCALQAIPRRPVVINTDEQHKFSRLDHVSLDWSACGAGIRCDFLTVDFSTCPTK